MSDEKFLDKDEYLIREGEESREMYYLSKGTLAIFKRKGNAVQQIGTIYKGELVGEMSFVDSLPRSASVMAITECELVTIHPEKIDKILKHQPPWFSALLKTLISRLRKTNNRVKI